MQRHLFISDLHLDISRPQHIQALHEFCAKKLQPSYHFYILGDLFEVWLGDDLGLIEHQDTIELLKNLTHQGVHVFIQKGNRDFLLGELFAKATGATLIPDEHIVHINNQPVLLMHGDSLCTDDKEYQAFRRQVRSLSWQQEFLSLSSKQRIEKANEYRQMSQAVTAQKDQSIMDVNPDTVQKTAQRHQVSTLIHGHTHLPKIHQHPTLTRIVLGDWRGHFDYLCWPENDTWHFLRQSV